MAPAADEERDWANYFAVTASGRLPSMRIPLPGPWSRTWPTIRMPDAYARSFGG